jgi:hypothetical protein
MSSAPRTCKSCGTALDATNQYPSDFKRGVRSCKSCKKRALDSLGSKNTVQGPQQSVDANSTPLPTPLPTPSPQMNSPSLVATQTSTSEDPELIGELLDDYVHIRNTPGWRALKRDGNLEDELNEPEVEPDEDL